MKNFLSYKPSVFYFRKALRESKSHREAVAVGLQICAELEQLKEWVRALGMIPPRQHITREEYDQKPELAKRRIAHRQHRN